MLCGYDRTTIAASTERDAHIAALDQEGAVRANTRNLGCVTARTTKMSRPDESRARDKEHQLTLTGDPSVPGL